MAGMIERICVLLLVNLAFFWRTRRFTYCSDDIPVYNACRTFKNKWEKRFKQLTAYARITPQEDHALVAILNGIVAVLIYLALGKNDISFLTALLVSFCPANNQCTIWVSGRWYVLVTCMILLSFIFPYFAPVFLLAGSVHPAGWFSSLVFLGSSKWYLAIIGIACMLYQLKTIRFMVDRKRKMEAVEEDNNINGNRIVIAIKTYGFYATLLLIPFKLTFYHSFLHSMAGNEILRKKAYKKDKWFYIGCSLLAYMLYSIFHWSPVGWGLLWYSIAIGPYTNLYRCQQEIAERYAYIASVGLLFALANLIVSYPALVGIYLAMYVTRLWTYAPAFQDDYWLIEYAVCEDPGAWYAWHTRALKRFDQGCIREALNMWVMAKMISPREFKVLVNIGVILKLMKKDDEAEKFFKEAEANIIPGQEEMANAILKDARGDKRPLCT